MPYPIWSMEATRTPTCLESLAAYAYEMGEGNIEAFCTTVIVLRPIAEVVVVIHGEEAPLWCGRLMGYTQAQISQASLIPVWQPELDQLTPYGSFLAVLVLVSCGIGVAGGGARSQGQVNLREAPLEPLGWGVRSGGGSPLSSFFCVWFVVPSLSSLPSSFLSPSSPLIQGRRYP